MDTLDWEKEWADYFEAFIKKHYNNQLKQLIYLGHSCKVELSLERLKNNREAVEWMYISNHPGLTKKIIEDNLDCPWAWPFISWQEFIDINFIKKYRNFPYNWTAVSTNKSITAQDILDNPDLPWCEVGISRNPNVNLQTILDHPEINWRKDFFSENINVTMDIVIANPDFGWSMERLSYNPNITIEYILARGLYNFNWYVLSSNEAITMDIVMEHPDLPWEWLGLSSNPNLTIDFIKANKASFDNQSITTICNNSISMKLIKDNLDLFNLDMDGIKWNKNINMEMFNAYVKYCNLSELLHKSFQEDKEAFMERKKKEWIKEIYPYMVHFLPPEIVNHIMKYL